MEVTIRYFDGCPNWMIARDRIGEALKISGRDDVNVKLELVETTEVAERLHFQGSPTVLVDGRDPFDRGATEFGLSCRVYQTEKGSEGSPSVQQLVAALGSAG